MTGRAVYGSDGTVGKLRQQRNRALLHEELDTIALLAPLAREKLVQAVETDIKSLEEVPARQMQDQLAAQGPRLIDGRIGEMLFLADAPIDLVAEPTVLRVLVAVDRKAFECCGEYALIHHRFIDGHGGRL